MKIGFTGTQLGMTQKQKETFARLLDILGVEEFHHGDCVGADTDAHKITVEKAIPIFIHPPVNPIKRAFNKSENILEEKPYLKRNHDIVDATEALIAVPKGYKEELRSGTWATIRYALKRDKGVAIIEPSGNVRYG